MRADAAAAFSCRNRSSSSGRVARGSSSSAVRVELSGGRVGDDGVFNQSWRIGEWIIYTFIQTEIFQINVRKTKSERRFT